MEAGPIGSPSRRVIATFDRYAKAEHAMHRLAGQQFPMERITIVAHGLRLVEHITGRRHPIQAVLLGSIAGAAIGSLASLGFPGLDSVGPWTMTIALLGGLAIGALAGLAAMTTTSRLRRWRDFSPTCSAKASRYELLCDADQAEEAVRRLGS
jgi:hypothetical protein